MQSCHRWCTGVLAAERCVLRMRTILLDTSVSTIFWQETGEYQFLVLFKNRWNVANWHFHWRTVHFYESFCKEKIFRAVAPECFFLGFCLEHCKYTGIESSRRPSACWRPRILKSLKPPKVCRFSQGLGKKVVIFRKFGGGPSSPQCYLNRADVGLSWATRWKSLEGLKGWHPEALPLLLHFKHAQLISWEHSKQRNVWKIGKSK